MIKRRTSVIIMVKCVPGAMVVFGILDSHRNIKTFLWILLNVMDNQPHSKSDKVKLIIGLGTVCAL